MIKKLQILATLFVLGLNTSFATTQVINIQGYSFVPGSVSIHLGDTVLFTWSSGIHTTTSTSIPSGATSWNSPLDSGHTSFTYVPAVTGAYSYQCTYHVAMGMTGSFTVLPPIAVPAVAVATPISIWPNPASSALNIRFNSTKKEIIVTVYDIIGRVAMTRNLLGSETATINISSLANGVYLLNTKTDGVSYTQKIIIAH